MYEEHSYDDHIVVEGELSVVAHTPSPPDDEGKDAPHQHTRSIRLQEDVHGPGTSSEATTRAEQA